LDSLGELEEINTQKAELREIKLAVEKPNQLPRLIDPREEARQLLQSLPEERREFYNKWREEWKKKYGWYSQRDLENMPTPELFRVYMRASDTGNETLKLLARLEIEKRNLPAPKKDILGRWIVDESAMEET